MASETEPANTSSTKPSATNSAERTKWPVLLLALVPCLLSGWFALSPSNAPVLTISRERPPLLFATYLYHHGIDPIELNSTLESEFRFRNDGAEPVTIGKIERSCGCMSPRLSSKTIAPGEMGSIYVPIQTVNQKPGPHEYLLTVNYSDSKPHQTTLTIKATFPEKMVVVEPKALYMSQRSDKAVPFNVAISDFRDETLKVTGVETTAAFVAVDLKEENGGKILQTSHTSESAAARSEIKGEVAGGIPPGRHHVLVAARTDDPEFPVITVPMIVNGPAYPEGEMPTVGTSLVQLTASERPGARRSANVPVVIPASWEISHATTWPVELTATYSKPKKLTEQDKQLTVTINLEKLPPCRIDHGLVQLIANDGSHLITIKPDLLWP